MSNKIRQGHALLGLTLENAKEMISRFSPRELEQIFQEAKEEGKRIQSREDMYVERVPDEILKKPFEIVK